jgi:hypothetical protein
VTPLDTLIASCTAVLAQTPDAVLTVRADVLLVYLEALRDVEAELPRYAVGDLVHHNGGLVQVRGIMAAANPHDRFWYVVGSRTVAMQQVRESVLRSVRNGVRDHA